MSCSQVSREKSDMLADELKNSITADTIPEVSQASTSSQPPEVVSPPQSKRSPVLPSRKDPLAKLKAKLKTQSRSRSRSPPRIPIPNLNPNSNPKPNKIPNPNPKLNPNSRSNPELNLIQIPSQTLSH
uniref:Uncharacterized protein n=1 Tax=Lotharella globosa TaxID=91324 RepID=A0A7S4DM12_9EUKA